MAQLCKPFTECSLWIIYPLPYHISPSYWLCTHRNMIYQASTAKLSLLTTTSAEKSLIISPYFSVMHSFAGSVDIFIVFQWIERAIYILYHPHVAFFAVTLFSIGFTILSVSRGPLLLPLMKINMRLRSITHWKRNVQTILLLYNAFKYGLSNVRTWMQDSMDFTPVIITLPLWNTAIWAADHLLIRVQFHKAD